MKIKIAFLCEDSSMLTIYIIDAERVSNYSFNIIILIVNITCFHFITKILYIWRVIIEKLQCQTVVGQEMVDINYLQTPIQMHFLVEL